MTDTPTTADERILVAVGSSPSSARVVEWAARRAGQLGAECVALSVETERPLSKGDRRRLDRNLSLARTLGARVEIAHDEDVAGTIVAIAKDYGASLIVVGKSGLSSRLRSLLSESVTDRVIRESGRVPVVVVRESAAPEKPPMESAEARVSARSAIRTAAAAAIFAALVALGHLIAPLVTYRGIMMIFLIPVIGLSFFASPRLIAAFAVCSSLALNYFFIPPLHTLSIDSLEDWLLFGTYFFAAIVTGGLVARLKSREEMIAKRQGATAFLLSAAERMTSCGSARDMVGVARGLVESQYNLRAAVYTVDRESGRIACASSFDEGSSEAEAARALETGIVEVDREAGGRIRIIPSKTGEEAVAAIGVELPENRVWTVSDDALIASLGNMLSLIVLRERSDAISRKSVLELESQRLAKVLLDSVSHEMRTPLTTVTGSLSALRDPAIVGNPASRAALVEGALEAAGKLDGVVEDLLSAGRIESGMLRLKRENVELSELEESALAEAEAALVGRVVGIEVPEPARMARVDVSLTVRLVSNLLKNAGKYSRAGSPVSLGLSVEGRDLVIAVGDSGPGVPEDRLQHLFGKFKRGESSQAISGLGLGLAICKGIAEAHGGGISASSGPGGFRVVAVFPDCAVEGEPPEERQP